MSEYTGKRDFDRTPEPEGGRKRSGDKPVFVIQEHDATSHHFDFRLEIDGELASWAVPKGPSTDPSERRLAIRTEDHPLDYADFEGVIPEDQYGGGTVSVWDRGPYRNVTENDDGDRVSMGEGLENGHLHVELDGRKLSGGYVLHRTDKGDRERWLLIKTDDDGADARRKPVSTEPESVLSGRTIEEIADEEEPESS